MTAIKDVKVYDLKECIVASGYAMRTEPYNYLEESCDDNLDHHIERCKRLVKASKNGDIHCHDNFLTGIRVSFDIKYPQYLSPEMQRYHFYDIVTSMSKMHRLLKMDIDKSCNMYVTQETKDNLKEYIKQYNDVMDFNEHTLDTKEAREAAYRAWMRVVSNCPLGLELWMRVSTNYKQLQTIYYQRRHHKLVEDWSAVIKMIEGLPYFESLILGEPEPQYSSPSI